MRAQRVLLLWCSVIPNPVATPGCTAPLSVDPRPDLLYVGTRYIDFFLVVSRADRMSDARVAAWSPASWLAETSCDHLFVRYRTTVHRTHPIVLTTRMQVFTDTVLW